MKRPYLSPQLDNQYQLVATRDGCLGLWGKVVYRGQSQGYTLIFRHYGYYPTGQAEGGEAFEISIRLPNQYTPLMQEIGQGYLYTWLSNLPLPRTDLLEREHPALEFWKVQDNQLSVAIVWDRLETDLSIIPNCVQRLIQVAEVIQSY